MLLARWVEHCGREKRGFDRALKAMNMENRSMEFITKEIIYLDQEKRLWQLFDSSKEYRVIKRAPRSP